MRLAAEPTRRSITGAAVIVFLASLVTVLLPPGGLPRHSVTVLVAFFVAIAVGELWQVNLLEVREMPPIATAASLAFAMTGEAPQGTEHAFGAATVVTVTTLAMAAGAGVHVLVRHRSVPVTTFSIGVIGTAVAALLFRELPLFDGMAALERQAHWAQERWITAVCMLAASGLALLLHLVLFGLARAAQERAPLRRVLVDEATALLPLFAALAASSALIALAERPLGALAIPLFLLPLVFLQFALRRHSSIRATYRQTVRSLSRLTELGGYTPAGHSARVAALAVVIGREVGLSESQVLELEYAALLHDIGQVSLTEPIPRGATVLVAPGDQRRIAMDGAQIVRETGELDRVALILEKQATPYRQVREFGEDLPLASRIIKVVNAFDDLVEGRPDELRSAAAIERIQLGMGYEYDPLAIEALSRVLDRRPQP